MEQSQNYKLGELIESIARGDPSAIAKIYELVGKAMKATAYTYVKNYVDMDDVVQEALITIVRKASQFRTNNNASAWINRIVSNLAKNKLSERKRKREVCLEESFGFMIEPNESAIIINEVFDYLTERERRFLIYRYWYGCSLSELAKIFHRSKTNVNYNLNKIFEKIRKYYKK